MKKTDILVIVIIILVLLPFFLSETVFNSFCDLTARYPLWMAFLKFGILATFGEMLGQRIKTGQYYHKEFGLFPKFIVWGFLGMWIALAMSVFKVGIPAFMERASCFAGVREAMGGDFSALKLAGAFFVSLMMNTSFAPVFMTFHKICDMHIAEYDGRAVALVKPIQVRKHIQNLNWDVQWNFVFKKTIPLFWIPAHTLTFCLPGEFQVLFAAFCSIILGLFLSLAAMKKNG
ncbi:MAG: Mpv17/PMP22 family protein [Bacteroidales bacterium]|nr:Mpv17/PMP22 family protein [Bacteroidales bacterium]